MSSIVITDLRTVQMREAQSYLMEQGYRVLTIPEGCCLCSGAVWSRRMRIPLPGHGTKGHWQPGA